jgi:hypothetical protein
MCTAAPRRGVRGVAGRHDGLAARGPGDGALPGVVLARAAVGEAGRVVAELAHHAGAEHDAEARLAEVDLSLRVATKMLAHHLAQACDLGVQRGDDPYPAADDRGVCAVQDRRLP